jgi:tetratricopeptide (TPR) repeat protein
MKSKFPGIFRSNPKPTGPAPGSGPAEQIEQARALHQQGQHGPAAALYRNILAAHPDNVDAQYRYGNLLKDQGAMEQALAQYDKAIELKADHTYAYCNRAVVLGLLNRLDEALTSYDRAIAFDPTDALAHCNRAMLLLARHDKEAALAGFEAAIERDPSNFPAHFTRGTLLQEQKNWAESLNSYDRAVAINPGAALAHYNRATVLKELNQLTAAVDSYGQAIALDPKLALAHANRAALLQELNQLQAALEGYDRAIELDNRDATTHTNRSVLLHRMGRTDEALAGYDRAVALNPLYAEAWFNRGTLLSDLDDTDAALENFERAIAARPGFDNAYVNRGVALQNKGQLREAIASYKQSLLSNPEMPETHFNLALAYLLTGDYAAGWAEYEWRWRAKGGPIYREKRTFRQPLWQGMEPIAGKTLLLYGEQGLGDSLQFCRYVELVAKHGARIILEVPQPLEKLCAELPGVAQVIAYGSPLPEFDCQCPLMSLPLSFGTTVNTIPSAAGYLKSDPGKVAAWQNRLGAKVKPRIGLTWSGNQTAGTNRKRHFALSSLLPHLSDGFHYYCLQTDVVAADQETLTNAPGFFQFQEHLKDFTDTAALSECMDLVISVDTSVAHLCGGLGRKTWIMLAYVADWRWLTEREDSPWYAAARLFRQTSPGDWKGVFERVAAALRVEFDR